MTATTRPPTNTRDFVEALESGDIRRIRKLPKSDLHNHCLMGGRLTLLEKLTGSKIKPFRSTGAGIQDINNWIATSLRQAFQHPQAFETAVRGAFLQARTDGVSVLEMSMDACLPRLFNIPAEKVIGILQQAHRETAPEIEFRPEVGMPRNLPVRIILSCLEPFFSSGYFKSIDLYDDEFAQPVESFREIYRFAKQAGMKCKAHAGEFGDAEFVRRSVEVLDLDAVQHGIGAAGSHEVMKWLAGRGTRLNVCPASNIILRRVRSWKTHPMRILFDHGVKVTVNTDDLMLFRKGNSEQYRELYRCGLFSAPELDEIRMTGISAPQNT
jgi:adenosine deaminase